MYQNQHGPTLIDRLRAGRLAIAIGILMTLAASAFAAIDELSVQGGTSTGGDAYTIAGRVGGEVRFSVTGNFNNVVDLFDGSGRLFASATIRDIWNGATPIEVVDRVQLSDGRSRVFLRVNQAAAFLNGGRLRLRAGNVEIDSDPLRLY